MKFQQPIISENGVRIYLPPNADVKHLSEPNMYADSVPKLFPIGTVAEAGQRRFAYSFAGDTLRGWARLLVDENDLPGTGSHNNHEGWEGNVYADVAAGVKIVDIEDTTARAIDYYEGGLFVVFNADATRSTSIRIAHSELGDGSTHVRLHLDDGLPWSIVAHDWCDAYRSPYSNITEPDEDGFEAFMGLSLNAIVSGRYFWLQIAGPTWVAQLGVSYHPGYAAKYRDVWAHSDGTIRSDDQSGLSQRVGYGLGSSAGASGGDTYIMLQMG